MKKLFGMTIAMMMGLSMIGCEETTDYTAMSTEPELAKEEQQIEEKEVETETEEVEENTVLTLEDETFRYYMTNTLTDEEYAGYFDGLDFLQEVEFDGCILVATLREGYDTRFEMLMMPCDYSETNLYGPYIKVNDIAGTKLKELVFGECNVRVKGKIEGYDKDSGYLEMSIEEIEAR